MSNIHSPDFNHGAPPPKQVPSPAERATFPQGVNVDRNRLHIRRGTESTIAPKDILTKSPEFTPEQGNIGVVREQYRRSLDNFGVTISELSRQASLTGKASRLEDLLEMPENGHIKKLVELAGQVDFDSEGNSLGTKLDPDKISKLLDDQEGVGMQFITGFISHEDARKMFVLGLYTRMDGLESDVDLGEDKKKVRTVVDRLLGDKKPKNNEDHEEALDDAWGRHQTLELRRFKSLFELAQSDPNEAASLKAIYHIDVNDFELTTKKKKWFGREIESVAIKPGRLPETINPEGIKAEAKQAFSARALYYNQVLGVPFSQIDGSPEQRILDYSLSNAPRTFGDKLELRIIAGFNPNVGGIRDVWGQHTSNPAFLRYDSSLTPSTIPEPSLSNLDQKGNMMRFQEARVKALVGLGEELIDVVRVEKGTEQSNKVVSTLDGQISSFNRTTEVEKKTTEAAEKKKKLTDRKEELEGEPIKNVYETFQVEDDKARSLAHRLSSEFGLTVSPQETSLEVLSVVNKKISDIETELDKVGGERTELERLLALSTSEVRGDMDKWLRAHPSWSKGKTPTPDEQKSALESFQQAANSKYGADIRKHKTKVDEAQLVITNLKSLEGEYRQADSARRKTEREILGQVPNVLTSVGEKFEDVVTTPMGIDANSLADKSIEDLVTVLSAPPYSKPHGTPEELAQLRTIALEAKVEALAQRQELSDAGPKEEVKAYDMVTTVSGATIKPSDLLSPSDAPLVAKLIAPPYSWKHGGPIDIEATLAKARSEASRRLRIRSKLMHDQELIDIGEQIKVQDKIIESAGKDVDKVLEYKKGANLLRKRQSDILSNASDITTDTTGRFFDKAKVKAGEKGFTKEEIDFSVKNGDVEKGYYELMDYFFDYRNAPDRNDRFKWIQEVLPPSRLLEIFQNPPFSLKTRKGGRVSVSNLSQGLAALDRERTTLGDQGLREAFISMINETMSEAVVK